MGRRAVRTWLFAIGLFVLAFIGVMIWNSIKSAIWRQVNHKVISSGAHLRGQEETGKALCFVTTVPPAFILQQLPEAPQIPRQAENAVFAHFFVADADEEAVVIHYGSKIGTTFRASITAAETAGRTEGVV